MTGTIMEPDVPGLSASQHKAGESKKRDVAGLCTEQHKATVG